MFIGDGVAVRFPGDVVVGAGLPVMFPSVVVGAHGSIVGAGVVVVGAGLACAATHKLSTTKPYSTATTANRTLLADGMRVAAILGFSGNVVCCLLSL